MLTERNIIHEAGNYWVCAANGQFTVYRTGATHSTADSSYADRSLAIARCDYLAAQEARHFVHGDSKQVAAALKAMRR